MTTNNARLHFPLYPKLNIVQHELKPRSRSTDKKSTSGRKPSKFQTETEMEERSRSSPFNARFMHTKQSVQSIKMSELEIPNIPVEPNVGRRIGLQDKKQFKSFDQRGSVRRNIWDSENDNIKNELIGHIEVDNCTKTDKSMNKSDGKHQRRIFNDKLNQTESLSPHHQNPKSRIQKKLKSDLSPTNTRNVITPNKVSHNLSNLSNVENNNSKKRKAHSVDFKAQWTPFDSQLTDTLNNNNNSNQAKETLKSIDLSDSTGSRTLQIPGKFATKSARNSKSSNRQFLIEKPVKLQQRYSAKGKNIKYSPKINSLRCRSIDNPLQHKFETKISQKLTIKTPRLSRSSKKSRKEQERELMNSSKFDKLHSIDIRERNMIKDPYQRKKPKKGILKKTSIFTNGKSPKIKSSHKGQANKNWASKTFNLLDFGFLSPRKFEMKKQAQAEKREKEKQAQAEQNNKNRVVFDEGRNEIFHVERYSWKPRENMFKLGFRFENFPNQNGNTSRNKHLVERRKQVQIFPQLFSHERVRNFNQINYAKQFN